MSEKIVKKSTKVVSKGPSIKDVSSEGEGGGYKKLHFGETFKGKVGRQGEGGGLKILKNEETSFMDDPLL